MPAFHIVRIEAGSEPEIMRGDDGEPFVFDSGQEAALNAEAWSAVSGVKHQPRRIKSNEDWRAREQARLDSGTYRALPWTSEPWFKRESTKDHFAHVSIKDESKIAFTENEAKGEADVQATMKPGRYLQAHYGDVLSPNEIKDATRVFAAYTNTDAADEDSLHFARTADEIEHVYLNGPESCMSHDPDDYSSPFLPVRVYAGFDLAVAYCTDGDGAIIARALCWPERKIYGRVYPGEHDGEGHYRLTELFRRDGFKQSSLEGARFSRVTAGWNDAIVCPYIDRLGRVTDCGRFMRLGDTGDGPCYQAESTEGFVEDEIDDRPTCDGCGDHYDEDDGVCLEDTGSVYCSDCAERNAHQCEATGEWFGRSRNVVTLSDGTVWSRSYFEDHGASCDNCGECERADDINEHGHCENCREDDDGEDGTPTPRIEHPDQLELPIPGASYRICYDGCNYVYFDGRFRTVTADYAEAMRVLHELRGLYPRVTYTIETVTADARLVA